MLVAESSKLKLHLCCSVCNCSESYMQMFNSKQHNYILIEHAHNYTHGYSCYYCYHIISSLGTVSQPAVFTAPVNWPALHDKLLQSHQLLNQPLTLPTALLVYYTHSNSHALHNISHHVTLQNTTTVMSSPSPNKITIISIVVNYTLALIKCPSLTT